MKIKESASKKITAYGFRKPGTKSIIHLLDDAQGYSRKFEVLERIAIRELKSKKKFYNGFQELKNIGFVKVRNNTKSQQVKMDKRLWDRDSLEIKIEHQLIYERLTQSARWLKKESLIRDIRNAIKAKTRNKPAHYAVDVHLQFILTISEYTENNNGLIRLAKFDSSENETATNKQTSLFNLIQTEQSRQSTKNESSRIENDIDEIDFDDDEDIFETLKDNPDQEDIYNNDNEINHDIFGNSNIDDGAEEEIEENYIETDIITENEEINNAIYAQLPTNFLDKIASNLQQIKHFEISESFNEIAIVFNHLKIKIEYDPSRKELLVFSKYDIVHNLIRKSLIMFSKAEMIGQLAIDNINNDDYLILKHRTSVSKYTFEEIISRIERVIYEAIQLQKLTI